MARRDHAAITMLQTFLSENSARVLELLNTIPEGASASVIDNLGAEPKRAVIEFGIRLEIMGYMVFRQLVDVMTANEMAGGTVLSYWSRAKGMGGRDAPAHHFSNGASGWLTRSPAGAAIGPMSRLICPTWTGTRECTAYEDLL